MPTNHRPQGPAQSIHEPIQFHQTLFAQSSRRETSRANGIWRRSTPTIGKTDITKVKGARYSKEMNAFSLDSVTQFPIWLKAVVNNSLSPEIEVTHPWTMMVKLQATNTTNRAMMCSGRFPFVIATAFVASSKISILVNTLVRLGQGLFVRHTIVWDIVCVATQG